MKFRSPEPFVLKEISCRLSGIYRYNRIHSSSRHDFAKRIITPIDISKKIVCHAFKSTRVKFSNYTDKSITRCSTISSFFLTMEIKSHENFQINAKNDTWISFFMNSLQIMPVTQLIRCHYKTNQSFFYVNIFWIWRFAQSCSRYIYLIAARTLFVSWRSHVSRIRKSPPYYRPSFDLVLTVHSQLPSVLDTGFRQLRILGTTHQELPLVLHRRRELQTHAVLQLRIAVIRLCCLLGILIDQKFLRSSLRAF